MAQPFSFGFDDDDIEQEEGQVEVLKDASSDNAVPSIGEANCTSPQRHNLEELVSTFPYLEAFKNLLSMFIETTIYTMMRNQHPIYL
jgi:hypothetical protein